MGIKQEGIKSSFWNMMTLMVNQIRNFIVSIVLARLLSPEDFGVLGMAMAFAGFVDAFVDFGFGNAIIQRQHVTQKQLSTVFYINLMIGTCLSIIMFVCSGLIAQYFNMPSLAVIVKAMSGTFIIKALEGLQNALMKKRLDFKTPFKINMTSGIVTGLLGIVLALCGYGVWSLVIMQIAGWGLTTIQIWAYNSWRPTMEFDLKCVSSLWNFGYKYSLSVTIDTIFCRLDTLVIGKMFQAATLGLFYRAQSLNKLVVQYSFSSISSVLFPAISKIKDDIDQVRCSVVQLLHIVSFLTFMFAGLMYVNSQEIIVLLYTDKWTGAIPIFKILGLFTFCTTIPNVLVAPLNSLGHSGKNLKIEIIKKTLVISAIPFGLYFGLFEYIFAIKIAAMIGVLLNMVALKCINLKVITQTEIIIRYAIPFFILVLLFEFIKLPHGLNNVVLLALKSSIYTIIYIHCHSKLHSRGWIIARDNLIKPTINKIYKLYDTYR